MRISQLGEGEIESVHRTERYVKLQMMLFYVVNLWFVALVAPSDLLAIRISREDEVEFVRRTERYVKLQMILFHVVNL